jgi:hypothetical protein
MNLKNLLAGTLLFIVSLAFSQSPGGVSSNLTSWFKPNVNLTVNSANEISQWQSTDSGVSLSQPSSGNKPILTSGSTDRLFNYNDHLSFNGFNQWLYDASAGGLLLNTGGAIFIVSKAEDGKPQLSYGNSSNLDIDIKGDRIGMTVVNGGTNKWQTNFSSSPIYGTNSDVVHEVAIRMTEVSTLPNCEMNGTDVTNVNTTMFGSTSPNNALTLGANGTTSPSFYGQTKIAEIISYDADLSDAEINQITSYLCMKYGVTKGVNGTSEDYQNSSGHVIYNQSDNSGYNYDVIAVAKDDGSGLDVSKAASVNGYGQQSLAYRDVIRLEIQSGSPLSNGDHIFFSNNNGALSGTTLSTPISDGANPAIEVLLGRKWKISHNNPSNGVRFIIDYTDFIHSGTLSDLRILLDADGDFNSGAVISTLTSNGGTELYFDIDPSLITDGSIITIGSIDAMQTPMPLDLISFDQRSGKSQSELIWSTINEENFSHFEIQRSIDGQNWTTIGRVDGKGHNNINNYNFWIDRPLYNSIYIRLKQIDYDLSYEFSKILTIEPKDQNSKIRIYPNPASDQFFFNLEQNPGTLEIRSLQGHLIKSLWIRPGEGSIDCSSMERGLYILQFKSNGHTITERLILR